MMDIENNNNSNEILENELRKYFDSESKLFNIPLGKDRALLKKLIHFEEDRLVRKSDFFFFFENKER
jgi:hypothetical protein